MIRQVPEWPEAAPGGGGHAEPAAVGVRVPLRAARPLRAPPGALAPRAQGGRQWQPLGGGVDQAARRAAADGRVRRAVQR
eukprot:9487419-Pyramimonas_sp.AAC.1